MARIEKIFASGTIAGVIFYELNGRPFARSKPSRVRQTTATKAAGLRFGSAKTVSRLLRQSLSPLLPGLSSKALMYRVDRGVMPWMRTVGHPGQAITPLPCFACSAEDGSGGLFPLPVIATLAGTTLQVTVLTTGRTGSPAGATKAVLTLVASCMDPQRAVVVQSGEQSVELEWPASAESEIGVSFDVVIQPGVLITLSAVLCYEQGTRAKSPAKEKRKTTPAAVIQGWYCGG